MTQGHSQTQRNGHRADRKS